MSRRHLSLLGVLLVVLVVGLGTQAVAAEIVIYGDDTEKPLVPTGFSPSEILIGVDAAEFFVLKTAAAGYTLPERARIVDMRITEVLSRRIVGPVTVQRLRGRPTIYVGPVRLVTVYPEDVAASSARSAAALAQAWAAGVRAALPKVMPGGVRASSVPPAGGVAAGGPVPAGGPAAESAGAAPHAGDVALGGKLLFTLRWANGFESLAERRAAVDRRVTAALSARCRPVSLVPAADGAVAIHANGMLIVEATGPDAAAFGKTTQELAREWASNLEDALALIAAAGEKKE